MLSEEEKKAIEKIKSFNQYNWEMNNLKGKEFAKPYFEALDTLLNLIKKQSKEIEELKEENRTQKRQLNDAFDRGWVHEDKIKAIIEEYEKALNILLQKNEWIEPSDTIIRNKFMHYIEFGQSLLEKE